LAIRSVVCLNRLEGLEAYFTTIEGVTPMKDTETSARRRIVAFLDRPARQEGNVHNKDDDDHDDDTR
jgi:hypothetical protein